MTENASNEYVTNLTNQIQNTTKIGIVQKFCELLLILSALLFCVLIFPFSILLSVKLVKDYQRIVILRLGRVLKKNAVGTVYLIPFIDAFHIVDLRLVTFSIEPQQILTRDSVAIQVDGIVFYRVDNAVISIVNVEDAHRSIQLLAQTTLMNTLGLHSIYEVLTDRKKIAASMQIVLDAMSFSFGIKVERVEIKDVRLPVQLQRAMAREAEETRSANAKVISANGEQKASVFYRNAAQTLDQSGAAKHSITLRYLQTLATISGDSSSVVFPLPANVMKFFLKNIPLRPHRKALNS